jgi:hypothetical protein
MRHGAAALAALGAILGAAPAASALPPVEAFDHYLQLAATRIRMLTELETFLAQHIGR